MNRLHKFGKLIIFDTLGIIFILAGISFGWLPGPGGIPLIIAGLGLLSINHEWARRWMEKVKEHGVNLADRIFIDRPLWKVFYDVLALVFIAIGIFVLLLQTHLWQLTGAVLCLFVGAGLFLGNRRRIQTLAKWLKSKR